MSGELVLDIDTVASIKRNMVEAGFSPCDVERLADSTETKLWLALRQLVIGEANAATQSFLNGALKRKDDKLYYNDRELMLVKCSTIGKNYAAVRARYAPNSMPPSDVLECLARHPYLVLQDWRGHSGRERWVAFLNTTEPTEPSEERPSTTGIYTNRDGEISFATELWDVSDEALCNGEEYVVVIA